MAIPYVKQTWTDGSGGGTPVSAARLGAMEQGIFDASYPPAVRVTHNANQSIATGTDTALAFNTEAFDQASNVADTMHDTVTNNSRLTCRYAGIYQINGNVLWTANATGFRYLYICLNGIVTQLERNAQPGSATENSQDISTQINLSVNDYVQLVVQQSSGGALNCLSSGLWAPSFSMVRVA